MKTTDAFFYKIHLKRFKQANIEYDKAIIKNDIERAELFYERMLKEIDILNQMLNKWISKYPQSKDIWKSTIEGNTNIKESIIKDFTSRKRETAEREKDE